jgi:hypothetical protein
MKAAGDKEGFWALFESGIQYVSTESASLCLKPLLSINAVMAHITYLLPVLETITGNTGTIRRVREFSRSSVLKRLETGATRKDLFYHLVR